MINGVVAGVAALETGVEVAEKVVSSPIEKKMLNLLKQI